MFLERRAYEWSETVIPGVLVCTGDDPCRCVRHPEVEDWISRSAGKERVEAPSGFTFALLDEVVQPLHNLWNGRSPYHIFSL